jgi:hypothetical protein
MKKLFYTLLVLLMLGAGQSFAAATAETTKTEAVDAASGQEVNVIITLTADGSGGAVTNFIIDAPGIQYNQLVEVEVENGTSTCALTITNWRGTTIWSLDALDATENKIYGGHIKWGIYPRKDTRWYLSTGTMDASDTVIVHLKFGTRQ